MKVPAVTLENVFAGLPAILSDNAQGGFLAARHLLARGCRNLVTISGQRNLHLSADERTVSFIRECERQGASCKVYSADEEMLKTMEYSRIVSRYLTKIQIWTEFLQVPTSSEHSVFRWHFHLDTRSRMRSRLSVMTM
ncbi:MAG: hypothetical protein V8S27_07375 [Lachnospiraceae bacterium]